MTKQTNTRSHTDIVALAASATVMTKRSCTLTPTAQSESL